MNKFVFSISLLVVLTQHAFAETGSLLPLKYGQPQSDFEQDVSSGTLTPQGISETAFNRAIDRVLNVYSPIIASQQASIKVMRFWNDSQVNAFACKNAKRQPITHCKDVEGKNWKLLLWGGLARQVEVTEDTYAMVLCHELAHFIGGAPYVYNDTEHVTNEGQSDYWAASVCFPAVTFVTSPNENDNQSFALPTDVKQSCLDKYAHEDAKKICLRSVEAGYRLATLLARIASDRSPSFATPDTSVQTKTYDFHPRAQCRLDTYYAGALGAPRPRCWFSPTNSDDVMGIFLSAWTASWN